MQPGEVRALENLPPAEGADRLFVNATLIPIDEVSSRTTPNQPAVDPAAPIDPAVAAEVPKRLVSPTVAKRVEDRLVRCGSLDDVDVSALTAGLNGTRPLILALLEQSKAAGDDVATFCALLWALTGGTR
jgi:hypothetical protein